MSINIELPNQTVVKDYTILRKLNSGGFSFVYMAKSNITGEIVAIKEYMPKRLKLREKGTVVYINNKDTKKIFDLNFTLFIKEMETISKIKHKNIVNIVDFFKANNTAYIVTPYEFGTPLINKVFYIKRNKTVFSEELLVKIFIGILEAIKELHDNGIFHLDLKPENIWLRPNNEIIILDFGTSLLKKDVRQGVSLLTQGYAAIEQHDRYNKPLKIDYWTDYYGIGATMFKLMTHDNPEPAINLVKNNKKNDIYSKSIINYHYKIMNAVDKLLDIKVSDRKLININEMINDLKNIKSFKNKNLDMLELILD